MIQDLIQSFALIFIAELGDKTQILAMAFATKYPGKKVILGIFLGSLLNHGLAVILGSYISNFIPINSIQVLAGLVFIIFAIWSLKIDDEDDEECNRKSKFGVVGTVAIAFFIGELGDKTQLTAITLSSESMYPIIVLTGTVLGMVATGGLGILIGKKINGKVPDIGIKLVAATIFMIFGIIKLTTSLPISILTTSNILVCSLLLSIIVGLMLKPIFIKYQGEIQFFTGIENHKLNNYYKLLSDELEMICLGESKCGVCLKNQCPIGNSKLIVKNRNSNIDMESDNYKLIKDKSFDYEEVSKSFLNILNYTNIKSKTNSDAIYRLRRNYELILFHKPTDIDDYILNLKIIENDNKNNIIESVLLKYDKVN